MRSSRERGGTSPRKPPGRPGAEDVDLQWLQAMESVWPDWDPPPSMHPDHPSAPLPRVDDALEGPPTTPRRTGAYDYRSTGLEPSEDPGIPLWLAKRVLAEAGDEAAAIRAAAQREAAEIRQQAAAMRQQAAAMRQQAAAVSEQAAAIRQQAAAISQQAADEAAAILAAAEREAAQMQAAVMTMLTELGDMAAQVTQSLSMPGVRANAAMPEPQVAVDAGGGSLNKAPARPRANPDPGG
jgi:hypothetical protein